ncbi:sensor histidine kinase [Mucilaginibacter dorajii]|uniref:histidine kinase n=1 Tax=Mucilaginibacter dorajii TaxID=692994 RepID=A0ABP7PUJ7_9SPHI|nr:HAMP domain-containing sensor histidine kinase [Mucilaginibacter dorajii]MCS3735018.1 signal transduction histidine kinase [Mucilaginibacter dorajii]
MFSSCERNNNQNINIKLKKTFQIVDSLVIAGKPDTAKKMLTTLRAKLKNDDPLIVDYYRMKAEGYHHNLLLMNRYADSAIAFFDNNSEAEKYPETYMQALLIKGDAEVLSQRYNLALRYYDKGKLLITGGSCDDGILNTKIAGIYYSQKNYLLAAQYWKMDYQRLGTCTTLTRQKLFYLQQSALNNTGVAYERAELIDSAATYYMRDLDLIQQADKANILDKHYINISSIVIYDNLGGISIKKGNYALAKQYLEKCISIPTVDMDGMRIPPYTKLANVYTRTGDFAKAADAFAKARKLLDLYWQDNPEAIIKWHKLYADYLFKIKQPQKAYYALGDYVRVTDSFEKSAAKIYRLDIDREFTALHQQEDITGLKQQDKLKLIYLAAITIVAILLIVIMVLIARNLKRARKGHSDTVLINDQLKNTLVELEVANQNYIRMMRVMAHDLRNPLWGITGLASMMLDEEAETISDDSKHALKLIESTGNNTMDMINELLKSGLDDENEPMATEKVNLKKLLFDSVELLRFKAKAKNQEIIFEADDTPVIAQVNSEKMWRVFNNVIVNAIKFSFEGGVIKVGMTQQGKSILIHVTDNGIGIPQKNGNGIFEMFTPNKRQGTAGEQPFGLGLSITKRIMEKHGGKIWFVSEPDKGTVFYMELDGEEKQAGND